MVFRPYVVGVDSGPEPLVWVRREHVDLCALPPDTVIRIRFWDARSRYLELTVVAQVPLTAPQGLLGYGAYVLIHNPDLFEYSGEEARLSQYAVFFGSTDQLLQDLAQYPSDRYGKLSRRQFLYFTFVSPDSFDDQRKMRIGQVIERTTFISRIEVQERPT